MKECRKYFETQFLNLSDTHKPFKWLKVGRNCIFSLETPIRRKSFVQPNVRPPMTGHQVSKPLMTTKIQQKSINQIISYTCNTFKTESRRTVVSKTYASSCAMTLEMDRLLFSVLFPGMYSKALVPYTTRPQFSIAPPKGGTAMESIFGYL